MKLEEAKQIVEANEMGKADNEFAYEEALKVVAEAKEEPKEVIEE